MAEILLEVDAVSAAYGNIRALQDVSLKVPQGAIVALLGANGAGKSTTLNVVSRLVAPRRAACVSQANPSTACRRRPWSAAASCKCRKAARSSAT